MLEMVLANYKPLKETKLGSLLLDRLESASVFWLIASLAEHKADDLRAACIASLKRIYAELPHCEELLGKEQAHQMAVDSHDAAFTDHSATAQQGLELLEKLPQTNDKRIIGDFVQFCFHKYMNEMVPPPRLLGSFVVQAFLTAEAINASRYVKTNGLLLIEAIQRLQDWESGTLGIIDRQYP
jgi:hypothetical protein